MIPLAPLLFLEFRESKEFRSPHPKKIQLPGAEEDAFPVKTFFAKKFIFTTPGKRDRKLWVTSADTYDRTVELGTTNALELADCFGVQSRAQLVTLSKGR